MEQNNVDKKMLKAYIGKNADKILNSNINIVAMFLGAFYFLYRKSYMLGIIFILANFVGPMWGLLKE